MRDSALARCIGWRQPGTNGVSRENGQTLGDGIFLIVKTYQDAYILLVCEILNCLVLLSLGHAPEVVEKVDILVLEHSANDAADVNKRGKNWIAQVSINVRKRSRF
jgi:hypothetical protein